MATTIVLTCATIIEKNEGTTYIHNNIYGAWWFYLLWGAMALFSVIYMCRVKMYKEISVCLLHGSFILILLGAITTALTAEQGRLYLPLDEGQSSYTNDDFQDVALPFIITLTDFRVEYYSGTKAPADYISYVRFDSDNGANVEAVVSMNKIARYNGYRFYQSEYDKFGSIVSVNRDIYGIPITYSGYILLVIALLLTLILPNAPFRRLLRSSALSKGAAVLFLVFCGGSLFASPISSVDCPTPRTLTNSQVELFRDLQVVYNNRVMPLSTLTHDFTLKLVGDTKYKKLSSNQFFWGWLLFPTKWEDEQIFSVPLSKKQEFLLLKPLSSYSDFFTDKGVYKLNHYIRNTEPKTQPALLKELKQLNERVQLVAMLRSGAMFKIFPYRDSSGDISWYSPIDKLPEEMEHGQKLFIKNSFDMLLSACVSGDGDEFALIASKIVSYQKKYGEESLLPSSKVRAEQLYYFLPITTIIYRLSLLLGVVSILLLVLKVKQSNIERVIVGVLKYNLLLSFIALTFFIGLKWFITGRMPLVNGYDTMVFLGWCITFIALLVARSSSLFTSMATLLTGFTMLVATLGGINPHITPLMPVLNSPFLTSHVCLIMLSYTLFAFTFINGILVVVFGRGDHLLVNKITLYSRIFLMLGLSFLSVGIFIGAVWANVSWGRYWAWDPKEVWALITMMLYALPLHSRSLSFFRRPLIFHLYMIIVFLSVLMTYFGVNYVLGGMHSYVN